MMASDESVPHDSLHTPLHALHVELGARMAPFAGYDMPISYPGGIIAEHLHTRAGAGLFDVSHMGQAIVHGPDHDETAWALERLCPADLIGLIPGQQRYTQFLNANGGILDDLMATRVEGRDGSIFLVVNAARKRGDFAFLEASLPAGVRLEILADRALLALQGPQAVAVLARLAPGVERMDFMSARALTIAGVAMHVSRSGYTGEDGFEIALPAQNAEEFARLLLAQPEVKPMGLGARDSLRLEAGLCLYGHDIDATTTPVEAGLTWSIGIRRRLEGGFPGDDEVRLQLSSGPPRRRVGIAVEGRAPVREGAEITDERGAVVGAVTSGGFGPSIGAPIAMGYVARDAARIGAPLGLNVRGKTLPGRVAKLPFHPHAYHRPG
jgi:aminomethyltransferase